MQRKAFPASLKIGPVADMDPCALYQRLAPTFAKHAAYHAPRWGVEAGDFEHWMWEKLLEKGAGVVHACGPLLDQTPAYIATWAARYAVKRVQREWQAECLDESMPDPAKRAYAETFSQYLERMGAEWGIDVSIALGAIGADEVSPEFEAYIRKLTPKDKRIAALLLSGLNRSHIDKQFRKIAPRRRTNRIHSELYQVLKKAA